MGERERKQPSLRTFEVAIKEYGRQCAAWGRNEGDARKLYEAHQRLIELWQKKQSAR